MPTQIFEELGRLPVGFLEQVIEYRLFGATFMAVTGAETSEARERAMSGPYGQLAHEIEFDLQHDDDEDDETSDG